MGVLERLTVANLKKNSRRTIVTILGVTLASALILAVAGMVTSFQKMMINYAKSEVGDYHDMFQEVEVEDIKYITDNNHVESYYFSEPISSENVTPEMLEYYGLYQNEPYGNEYIAPFDELPNTTNAKYNVFVRYDRPQNYQSYRENILQTLKGVADYQIGVRTNDELLRYEAAVMSDAALATLYSLATIVIGIIVITSVFVIRNSFSISAAERQRQFGMLASIGATPRQIRGSVLFEGVVIGAIGIPLGMICGSIAVAILVMIVNYLLQGAMPIDVEFSMPLWIFPLAIVLSFATILLSSLMPAIRAGRMSPVEAIRGNQEIKVKAKKLHTSKLTEKIFGIGGVIASKNLKRSRKKYRTTVVSIILSVATFIGLASFLDYGKAVIGIQYTNSDIDVVVQGGNLELYQNVQEHFNLSDSAYYIGYNASREASVMLMSQSAFEKFAKQNGVNEKDYSRTALFYDRGMQLLEDGRFDMNRVTNLKDGDTYTASIIPDTPAECQHERTITQEGYGTSLIIDVDEECVKKLGAGEFELDIKITKIIDQQPLGLEGTHHPIIYLPENTYLKDQLKLEFGYYGNFFIANVDNAQEIVEYTEKLFEEKGFDDYYYIADVKENTAQMRRMYLLICIFLYGFIIVVMLIGVTNIFNTITTNIALRAKEFAMLKSIGMTKHEFDHMIRLESLMYASRALIIGLPLGLLLSYGFYQSIANAVDFGWSIPWLAILISIVAVALLISVIMTYSVRQVEKQNIIETIRRDNI